MKCLRKAALLWALCTFHVLPSSLAQEISNCGLRFESKNDPAQDSTYPKRIVGGSESQQGSWPWQVAVLIYGVHWCGGSLINENWVVTAAHCVHWSWIWQSKSYSVAPFTLTLGEHKLGVKELFEQVRKVERIIVHPNYTVSSDFVDNDVALLKLDSPATFGKFVRPVCLLPSNVTFPWGKECYVTGWGYTQFMGTKPTALNEAKVQLVSHDVCNQEQSYKGNIHDVALCAGYKEGGVDACQYDSGGPLVCEEQGKFYLTGVVSWGYECARPHKYGVYVNMMKLTSWVREQIP